MRKKLLTKKLLLICISIVILIEVGIFFTRYQENSKNRKILSDFLQTQTMKEGEHHFCIVKFIEEEKESPWRYAWVYWQEGNKLILWEGEDDLTLSRRQLDLKEDTVATDEEVGYSTYLVTEDWVRATIKECDERGSKYVLKLK
jgi:hypothetical protein